MQIHEDFKLKKARIGYIERDKNGGVVFRHFKDSIGLERVYAIDEKNCIAIDIDSMLSYPFINTINMQYIKTGQNLEKYSPTDRIVCCPFDLELSSLSSRSLKNVEYVIKALEAGMKFPDGNQEMSCKEFDDMMTGNESKEHKKRVNVFKKTIRKVRKGKK